MENGTCALDLASQKVERILEIESNIGSVVKAARRRCGYILLLEPYIYRLEILTMNPWEQLKNALESIRGLPILYLVTNI